MTLPWSEWKLDVTPGVWRKLRRSVLDAAGWRCSLCGAVLHRRQCKPKACGLDAQVDHVTPLAAGGRSVVENLRAVCRSCNQLRAHGMPTEHTAPPVVHSREW